MHQHGPDRLQPNSAPQPAQARRRAGWISDRFVMNGAAFPCGINLGFSSNGGIIPPNIRPEMLKGNRMARDSQAALVALNRFGFGARGGASGDFVNAASDPRGFVKAELLRPNGE